MLKGMWSAFPVDLKAKSMKMLFHRMRFLFGYFTSFYVATTIYISGFRVKYRNGDLEEWFRSHSWVTTCFSDVQIQHFAMYH